MLIGVVDLWGPTHAWGKNIKRKEKEKVENDEQQ